jgi:hypothetical protein
MISDGLLGRLARAKLSQSSSPSSDLAGLGSLVVFVLILAAIVFPVLGTSIQRKVYFGIFSRPVAPQGSYASIAVRESKLADTYEITIFGTGHLADKADKGLAGLIAGSGVVYTLRCTPHFWNRCAPLSPDSLYYARWLSPDHSQLAISTLVTGKDGRSWINSEEAQFYELAGWSKRDTLQIRAPSGLAETFKNGGFSFRYPQGWQVEQGVQGTDWNATIAPPEARVGTWVTHGFFAGHVGSRSPGSASTPEGAFSQGLALFEKRGFSFIASSKRERMVSDRRSLMISYTQPGPLSVGERGHLVVTSDGSNGYYYFLMFSPNDEQTTSFAPVFDAVLDSVKVAEKQ